MKEYVIFTEAFGCGIVLKNALKSFHKYHDEKVYIYGAQLDFSQLEAHPNNIFVDLTKYNFIKDGYKSGHEGTARIMTKAISDHRGKYIIHFDSDVIFRDNIVDMLKDKMKDYHLIGSRRCYRNNITYDPVHYNQPDVIALYLMAFDSSKISNYPYDVIIKMCRGHDPKGKPMIDFFDAVSFDILDNGGKSYFFDPKIIGGLNEDGSRYEDLQGFNQMLDFGDAIIHFAGAPSGYRFSSDLNNKEQESYIKWAINRWKIYSFIFENGEKPEISEEEIQKYEELKECIK